MKNFDWIFRVLDISEYEKDKNQLYVGTGFLVSPKGYALTAWHNFDFDFRLPRFEDERELDNLRIAPRRGDPVEQHDWATAKVVGKWSNRDEDFAVLKLDPEIVNAFRLRPAPLSLSISSGLKVVATGFHRPSQLPDADQVWGYLPSESDPRKTLKPNQQVIEVIYKDLPFEQGMSGGPLALVDLNYVIGIETASDLPYRGSDGYPIFATMFNKEEARGYATPISVVRETWTNIGDYCQIIDVTSIYTLPTAEFFPRSPKPSDDSYIKAVKAKSSARASEDQSGKVVQFESELESGEFGEDAALRIHKYADVEKFPYKLSKRLEIPEKLGTFRLVNELGRGGFTVVWLAKDVTSWLDANVVLKIPTRQRLGEEWMSRVLHEAKVWKALSDTDHPNILKLLDLKRVSPFTFFVTEYMDGGNLASTLDNVADSDMIPLVTKTLLQICEGLAYAHRRGFVHGDIKPQNILVSADLKRVKLGDFGLTFQWEEMNLDKAEKPKIAGTLLFLAPESFDRKRTPQTDIYALGVTLYYLLTGQYPFSNDLSGSFNASKSEKIEKLKAERIAFRPNLGTVRPDIPSWLEGVIQRCMAPRPEDRFSNATELLEYIIPFIDPSKGQRLVLTAWCNPESQTIDYDIEVKGQRSLEMLTVEVTLDTIKGLCGQWEKIGELALERISTREEGLTTEAIDEDIRDLVSTVAEAGADFILGSKVSKILQDQRSVSLWLLHDPRLSAVPWELLKVQESHICRRFPIARRPRSLRMHSPRSIQGSAEQKIRVLLIADPAGSLPGAKRECERLQREFESCTIADRIIVDVADESTDSFSLRIKMRRCHILHYAGHAVWSEKHGDLSASGWLFRGDIRTPESGDLLRASALEEFWAQNPPLLVFGNACFSGKSYPARLRLRGNSDAAMGLAQAFLSAGIGNYVGTVWEAPDDEAAAEFSSTFYRLFFAGQTVSQAILEARNFCAEKFGEEDLTWARYVLFGDPFTRIET